MGEDLPRTVPPDLRDIRRPDEPPALPGEPVQGTARAAREIPCVVRRPVLLRRGFLADAGGSHRIGHGAAAGRSAAPVLPVIADRRVEEAGVLADLLVHPRRHVHARNPHRLPVGGFRRGQRKGRNRAELRHDTIAGAAQGLQRSRTGAGAEQLQRERGRVEGVEPARIRFHQGQPRQPADTAAGWRSGVCAAGVRAVQRIDQLPAAQEGAGGVRRPGRIRQYARRGARPGVRRQFGCVRGRCREFRQHVSKR